MSIVDKYDDGRGAIDVGCFEYFCLVGVAENRFMTFLLGVAKVLYVLLDCQVWNFGCFECECY